LILFGEGVVTAKRESWVSRGRKGEKPGLPAAMGVKSKIAKTDLARNRSAWLRATVVSLNAV
jgi:hypothetical protein